MADDTPAWASGGDTPAWATQPTPPQNDVPEWATQSASPAAPVAPTKTPEQKVTVKFGEPRTDPNIVKKIALPIPPLSSGGEDPVTFSSFKPGDDPIIKETSRSLRPQGKRYEPTPGMSAYRRELWRDAGAQIWQNFKNAIDEGRQAQLQTYRATKSPDNYDQAQVGSWLAGIAGPVKNAPSMDSKVLPFVAKEEYTAKAGIAAMVENMGQLVQTTVESYGGNGEAARREFREDFDALAADTAAGPMSVGGKLAEETDVINEIDKVTLTTAAKQVIKRHMDKLGIPAEKQDTILQRIEKLANARSSLRDVRDAADNADTSKIEGLVQEGAQSLLGTEASAPATISETAPGTAAADETAGGQLVVARKAPDGSVSYGEPDGTHRTLLRPGEPTDTMANPEMGFAQKGGPWMDRVKALRWVEKNDPEAYAKLTANSDEFERLWEEGLTSERYGAAIGNPKPQTPLNIGGPDNAAVAAGNQPPAPPAGTPPQGLGSMPEPTQPFSIRDPQALEHELNKLGGNATADTAEIVEPVKKAFDAIPRENTRAILMQYQEQPNLVKLTPEEDALFKQYVLPVIREREAIVRETNKIMGLDKSFDFPEWPAPMPDDPTISYAPRYALDKGSVPDWLALQAGTARETARPRGLGARGFSTSTTATKSRTVEGPMAASDKGYYTDAVANNYIALLEAKKRLRNVQFMQKLMGSNEWNEVAVRSSGTMEHAGDWKEGSGLSLGGWSPFNGWRIEPHVYDALKSFVKQYDRDNDFTNAVARINRGMFAWLFMNPIRHSLNMLNDSLVSAGATGMIKGAVNPIGTLKDFFSAMHSVSSLDKDYVTMLRKGVSMQYGNQATADLFKFLSERVGQEIANQPGAAATARMFGFSNVADMQRGLTKWSQEHMWMFGDALRMMRVKEEMRKGMTVEEAMRYVDKSIANYRVGSRVAGSTAVAQALSSPAVLVFSRYRLGVFRQLGSIVRDVVKGTGKEKLQALNRLGALGAIVMGMEALNETVQKKTGVRVGPFGSSSLVTAILHMFEGKGTPANVATRAFDFTPLINTAEGVINNRDPYTGQTIMAGGPVTSAARMGDFLLNELPIVGDIDRFLAGRQNLGGLGLRMSGVGTRLTPEQEAMQRKMQHRGSLQANKQTMKRPGGAFEVLEDWLKKKGIVR